MLKHNEITMTYLTKVNNQSTNKIMNYVSQQTLA